MLVIFVTEIRQSGEKNVGKTYVRSGHSLLPCFVVNKDYLFDKD